MVTIFAPHPDDELIGCWSLIDGASPLRVVYCSADPYGRHIEAQKAGEDLKFKQVFFHVNNVNRTLPLFIHDRVTEDDVCWAPDLHWEAHPLHKLVGALVHEACLRLGKTFGTYSTNMNVPYLRELSHEESTSKRNALNLYYPSQKDLWRYDHRYFLFEGRALWNPAV